MSRINIRFCRMMAKRRQAEKKKTKGTDEKNEIFEYSDENYFRRLNWS